jgi:hypothetical protein
MRSLKGLDLLNLDLSFSFYLKIWTGYLFLFVCFSFNNQIAWVVLEAFQTYKASMGKLKLRVPKWNVVKPTGTKLLSEVMILTDY